MQILGGIDNLGIRPTAATGLIKGVALVLSRLPHENIRAVMKALCALSLGPLTVALKSLHPIMNAKFLLENIKPCKQSNNREVQIGEKRLFSAVPPSSFLVLVSDP